MVYLVIALLLPGIIVTVWLGPLIAIGLGAMCAALGVAFWKEFRQRSTTWRVLPFLLAGSLIFCGAVSRTSSKAKKKDQTTPTAHETTGTNTPSAPARSPAAPRTAPQPLAQPGQLNLETGAIARAAPIAPSAPAARKLPIEMSWSEAEAYLKARGMESRSLSNNPANLGGVSSAEAISFDYSTHGDEGPPKCVGIIFHDLKIRGDWRSAITRLTGVDAAKFAKPKPFDMKRGVARKTIVTVDTRRGPLELRYDEDAVVVGNCR